MLPKCPPTLLLAHPNPSLLSITLNRPSAFNALDYTQAKFLKKIYGYLSTLPTPPTIILKGSDTGKKTKAFCSGGDVRQIYDEGMWRWQGKSSPPSTLPEVDVTSDFFYSEYQLNTLISKHPSQISVYSGICMGGGVGLSIHGSHRISTSSTVFAMPETGIGLFPDVGGSVWLPKLKGGWGVYLRVYLRLQLCKLPHNFFIVGSQCCKLQ